MKLLYAALSKFLQLSAQIYSFYKSVDQSAEIFGQKLVIRDFLYHQIRSEFPCNFLNCIFWVQR